MLSHTGHVMTLANSIIGASILAMPFCFQKCGIILSIFLLIVSNWITRICCHYLIKSSLLTRRKSFEFLGFQAFGSSGKLFVELCITGFLLGTCITYYVVVGDLGPHIITKMFTLDRDIAHLRFYFIFAVTLVCILPLAMLKNVDSLSAVCTASIGFYICLVIKIILESKSHILTGDWTSNVVYWRPAGILQCLPIFSMALSCQMQLFEVFTSVNNQSVEKLNGIVRDSTWICTMVYIAFGFFGYVAFCKQTFSGNILLNFSQSFGSDVIKIGFILSVAFSFPLVIFPCRASIYSLLYRKGHTDAAGGYIPETRFKMITIFIVGLTLCIALMIPSIELIIGLVGSTIGVAICIMFPAACFRRITKKNTNDRSVALSSIILVSGFFLMVLGTYANLNAIDEHNSGAHLNVQSIRNKGTKRSEIPAVKDEVQKFIGDKLKVFEDKKGPNLEKPKLSQAEVKNEIPLNRIDMSKEEEVNKKLNIPLSLILPKELQNDNERIQKLLQENLKEKPAFDEQRDNTPIGFKPMDSKNLSKNDGKQLGIAKAHMPLPDPRILAAPAAFMDSANVVLAKNVNVLQQTIDRDAIKKDEDIAAEERNSKIASKNADDELKKAQKELQKTKELLERKVDEIKEELVKQNEKTQNLVAEKLEEVVQKVEKIERKVQRNEVHIKNEKPKIDNPEVTIDTHNKQDRFSQKLAEVAKQVGEIEERVQQAEKEIKTNEISLKAEKNDMVSNQIIILTDKITKTPKPQVYDPISYKIAEIIEDVSNTTKLESNLPLPLPLLINSSRNNPNDIEINQDPPKIVSQDQLKLPLENFNTTNLVQPKVDSPNHIQSSIPKENVIAIRRDILELNTENLVTTVKSSKDPNEFQKRFRRSSDINVHDIKNIDIKLDKKNCLSEPKMDTLMHFGSSGVLEFKKQGIGRDLKSLQDDKQQEH